MSKHRHKAREKNVQKFSRDGLIEQNLVTGESTHVSKREADQELRHSSSTEFEVKSSGDSSQHFGSHGTNVTPASSEKRHTVLNVENETRITSTDSLPQQETQNYQSTTGYEPGTYAKDDDYHAQDQSAHSQSDTSYAQNYSTHSQSDTTYPQHQQYQKPASHNQHNESYSVSRDHSGNHVPISSHHAQKTINRFSESSTSAVPNCQDNQHQDYQNYSDYQYYQDHPDTPNEVLVVPKTVDMDYRDLEAMVQEINANEVAPADRLSDHVYEYDAKDHELFRSDRAEERQAEKAAKKEKAKEKTEEKKPSVLGKLKNAQEKVNSTPVQAGPAHKKEVSL